MNKTLEEITETLKDKPDYTHVETTWGHFKELLAQAEAKVCEEELRRCKMVMLGVVTKMAAKNMLYESQVSRFNELVNEALD